MKTSLVVTTQKQKSNKPAQQERNKPMSDLRMPDVNNTEVVGRLTRDPELHYTGSGIAVCTFGIAVSKKFKDAGGATKEKTVFLDCKCWKQQAEWVGEKISKGDPVLVNGELAMDEWDDKATGKKRTKIIINAFKVQMLAWAEGQNSQGGNQGQRQNNNGPGGASDQQRGYNQQHSSGGGQQGGYQGGSQGGYNQGGQPQPRVIEEPIPEDDIPF